MAMSGMSLLLYRRGGCVHIKVVGVAAMARRGWGTRRGWLPRFWRGWIRNLPMLKKDIVGRFGGDRWRRGKAKYLIFSLFGRLEYDI